MDRVFLVYEEYRYNGCGNDLNVFLCASMDIAICMVKEQLKWYLENTYLNNFVDENLNVKKEMLDKKYDTWKVSEDSVEIYIDDRTTCLNIHIVKKEIITKLNKTKYDNYM